MVQIQKSSTILNYTPYEASFNKLRNNNPREHGFSHFSSFLDGRLTTKEPLCKIKLNKAPLVVQETYQFVLGVWQHKKHAPSKTFDNGITTKTLSQRNVLCLLRLVLSTVKQLTCWNLGVCSRF